MSNWKRGDFVKLSDRCGIVVQADPVGVQWNDREVGSVDVVADPSQLISEYRYSPPWWDPIARDYRPGEELKFARMKRGLKALGLW